MVGSVKAGEWFGELAAIRTTEGGAKKDEADFAVKEILVGHPALDAKKPPPLRLVISSPRPPNVPLVSTWSSL